jgi:hypothetical protein
MAFDPNKPVKTRGEQPARIVCADVKSARPILALVTSSDGSERAYAYYANGHSQKHGTYEFDLVNEPVTRMITVRRWLIVYNDGTNTVCCEPPPRGSREVFAVRELDIRAALTEGEGLTND